jgi:hypothetical protein
VQACSFQGRAGLLTLLQQHCPQQLAFGEGSEYVSFTSGRLYDVNKIQRLI